jgi:hypothetical protein
MHFTRTRSVDPQWTNFENRLDNLASKVHLLERLEKLQSESYMYFETDKEEKIFKAGPRGFELVKSAEKEVKEDTSQQVQKSPDALQYLNEMISELSAVEDAEALLSGDPKVVKKEDGTIDLFESSKIST